MIAAGEVVENPASMIKELLENSLDANSQNIIIEVSNNGRNVIIKDDGKGMVKNDLLRSIERHATSKIFSKDDLFKLSTYGFRGEALSSISGVSRMSLSSKTEDSNIGNYITVLGGKITSIKETTMNRGTNIEIKDLFFNTPARLKFLRKTNTEYSHIKDIVMKEALTNYNVSITLILDGKVSIKTTGNGIENTIIEIFSLNTIKNSKKFENGYLGNSALFKNNRDSIFIFVNNRPVKSKLIENAIIDGYYTKLMKGKFPFAIYFYDIDPEKVDVNVHPSKKIVKFSNETNVYSDVLTKVKHAIEYDDDFIAPSISDSFFEKNNGNSPVENNFSFSKENITDEKSESNHFNQEENNFSNKNLGEKVEENSTTDNQLKSNNNSLCKEKKDNFSLSNSLNNESTKNLYKDSQISFSETFSTSYNNLGQEDSSFNSNTFTEKEPNFYEICEKFVGDNLEETPKENFVNKRKNIDFKVFGQVFNTFILVERNNIFEIYDQHIIHERILYEELKNHYYNKKIDKQLLLIPLKLEIDIREKNIISDNLNIFEEFGYDIEIIDDKEIYIRSVPIMNMRNSTENIFREILENLKENKEKDIRESIIISMSCKGAIKANEKLTIDEMIDIICRLHEIGKYTCPHGRPIIAKISLNDLEKLFKRKL